MRISRPKEMNGPLIRALLMRSMRDYLSSHDAARTRVMLSPRREEQIEQGMVVGKCVQRIAIIKHALETMQKNRVRDALKQCLEDCLATYEMARVSAEETPIIAQRSEFEKLKAHSVQRKFELQAALDELT